MSWAICFIRDLSFKIHKGRRDGSNKTYCYKCAVKNPSSVESISANFVDSREKRSKAHILTRPWTLDSYPASQGGRHVKLCAADTSSLLLPKKALENVEVECRKKTPRRAEEAEVVMSRRVPRRPPRTPPARPPRTPPARPPRTPPARPPRTPLARPPRTPKARPPRTPPAPPPQVEQDPAKRSGVLEPSGRHTWGKIQLMGGDLRQILPSPLVTLIVLKYNWSVFLRTYLYLLLFFTYGVFFFKLKVFKSQLGACFFLCTWPSVRARTSKYIRNNTHPAECTCHWSLVIVFARIIT